MQNDFHVIVLAAGNGPCFGGDLPKQYCHLAGKPLLRHSIDTFLSLDSCKQISVVIKPEHIELYNKAIEGIAPDKVEAIEGGTERHDSVYNALSLLDNTKQDDIVLIHDATRPFVSKQAITSLLQDMNGSDAATLASPIDDTLQYKGGHCAIAENNKHPSSENLWAMQTPQAFRYNLIYDAHKNAKNDLLGYADITDDASLVQKTGHKVTIIANSRMNFKITEQEDLMMAEMLMQQQTQTKMATGYNVQAFEEYEVVGNQIKLGGIFIPHKFELKGNSGNDVVLNALTDALNGVTANRESKHSGKDSALLLKTAHDAITKQHGTIAHVDLTIICEEPEIDLRRDDMRNSIAKLLNMDITGVSIKGSNTKGLGFTGRREGIAAQAAVTVEFKRS